MALKLLIAGVPPVSPTQEPVSIARIPSSRKVCIRIEDDGAGRDPVKLKTKAIEKRDHHNEQAAMMTDNEYYRLIFCTVFYLLHKSPMLSGRGVGMTS